MDLYNPWIALHKAWIHVLHDNPQFTCSNCGLCSVNNTKHGFAQSMDMCSDSHHSVHFV